jgi:isoleucyl-tRNA synthetase
MTRLMAPVLSFTAEEVWQSIRQSTKGKEHGSQTIDGSVFLTTFPEVDERYVDCELEMRWNDLFILRNEVNKALEVKRAEKFIGNSLEAKVILYLPDKYNVLITAYEDLLPTFFIVSAVEITNTVIEGSYKSAEVQGLEITVERAAGNKCQRCWNWSELVGTFADAPEICERCYKVIYK